MITLQLTLLLILFVVGGGAIASQRFRLSYLLLVSILGFLWGLFPTLDIPTLDLFVVGSVCFPLFLFSPIFATELGVLAENGFGILMFSIPGFLVMLGVFGGIFAWVFTLPLNTGFLLGILLLLSYSLSLKPRLDAGGVPQKWQAFLMGEGVFTPVLGLLGWTFGLNAIAGGSFTEGLVAAVGGGLIGIIIATGASLLLPLLKQSLRRLTFLMMLTLYGAFALAEWGQTGAGITAVVAVGFVLNWESRHSVSPKTVQHLKTIAQDSTYLLQCILLFFWSEQVGSIFLETVANAIVWPWIFLALGLILVSRAIAIFLLFPLINFLQPDQPLIKRNLQIALITAKTVHPLTIGLGYSLSLLPSFPHQNLVIFTLWAVTLIHGFIPSVLISPLLEKLHLTYPPFFQEMQEKSQQLYRQQQTLTKLKQLGKIPSFSASALQSVQQQYQDELYQSEIQVTRFWTNPLLLPEVYLQVLWLQALIWEKQGYQKLYEDGVLWESALYRLLLHVEQKKDTVLMGKLNPSLRFLPKPISLYEQVFIQLKGLFLFNFNAFREFRLEKKYRDGQMAIAVFHTCKQVAFRLQWLNENHNLKLPPDCAQAYHKESAIAKHILQKIPNLDQFHKQHILDKLLEQ